MPDTQTATTSTNKPQGTVNKSGRSGRILIRLGVAVAILAALLSGGYYYFFHNYAKDAAGPLEISLIKDGAIKEPNTTGDAGRGPDNVEPWYEVGFKFNASKDEAVRLINNAAMENGYHLTHASPVDRGHLGAIADAYIDNWWFDDSSKRANFPGVSNRPVILQISLVGLDANHTNVLMRVRLPREAY